MGICTSKSTKPRQISQPNLHKQPPKSALTDQRAPEINKVIVNDKEQKLHQDIEKYLQKEKEIYDKERNEPRILILGPSDSGKSTFLKQLKIIHGNGFTKQELIVTKKSLLFNLFGIAQYVLKELPSEDIVAFEPLMSYTRNLAITQIPPNIIHNLWEFWNHPLCKQKYLELNSLFPHTSGHFFDRILQIGAEDYEMTPDDMLLFRAVTQQISDNVFEINNRNEKHRLHFIDVSGLKYHRKRWIPYFQDVLAIIFVVDLSGYDLMLSESKDINRMVDAIELFHHIINHPLLLKPDMILFFNKTDLFTVKVNTSPIQMHFPDYTGQLGDIEAGITFFTDKFRNQCRNKAKHISIHRTCCTDTSLMNRIINDVVYLILKNVVQDMVGL
ncbi:guanine nucleotide binding protein, alpha subunit [Globomyces pollinis-pini]|nr:guanine nucleotide binding protein, alpha subunit [Globomyces pollinis-pini]